jgi:hypothetical protein
MKPLIVAPLAAIVLGGAGFGVYLAVAGAGSGEEGALVVSPPAVEASATAAPAADTPTAELTQEPAQAPGGGGGGGLEGTAVPIVTPLPTPPPVPADWATYSDPHGRFTFNYPPTWFLDRAGERPPAGAVDTSVVSLFTYDRASWPERYPPPNSVKVEIHSVSLSAGVAICEPDGAAPALLGGVTGWQVVTVYDMAADYPGVPAESRLTRVHQVAAERNGYRFCLIAQFAGADPDEATFLQIVGTFTFAK